MLNPRIIIQLPLLLIGSCVPITPSTPPTITIYNSLTASVESSKNTDKLTCNKQHLEWMKHYTLPALPDLSSVDEDDPRAIIDALTDHIVLLRKELTAMTGSNPCS